jgi:hypothetical protein
MTRDEYYEMIAASYLIDEIKEKERNKNRKK